MGLVAQWNHRQGLEFLPVVGPVEFTVGRNGGVRRTFPAHPSAKDEANNETHEAKYEHKHAQVPLIDINQQQVDY